MGLVVWFRWLLSGGLEASGMDEATDGVAGQVAEAQGDAA